MRPVWHAFGVLPAVDTGNDDVHSADVRVFDGATGELVRDFMAPAQTFINLPDGGGVPTGTHVGSIDHNFTRLDDILVSYGDNVESVVNVYDFNSGNRIDYFFAYNPLFQGGVFIGSGH